MAETTQNTVATPTSHTARLIRAAEVAGQAEVRQSANGVQFATFGETGVPAIDLDRMLEAVPVSITAALRSNTYYFVPLALREPDQISGPSGVSPRNQRAEENALVAPEYSDEWNDAAICHRNVELGSGRRGVFISTRLMNDRFALGFEFFINVAHALVDEAGVPASFAELVWQQALAGVKGETSLDAWESRHAALGQRPQLPVEAPKTVSRRERRPVRAFSTVSVQAAAAEPAKIDERERLSFIEVAFSDAVAVYLLSLAMDVEYSELRERDYPLLAPNALATRLRAVAELFPANAGYEFSVRYRRRA